MTMHCNQLPKYCVHHSTPKKIRNRLDHCSFLDETPVKLEKGFSGADGGENVSILTTQNAQNPYGGNYHNGSLQDSDRVQEVQKRKFIIIVEIVALRDCNELLLNHIKKLFDSAYQYTQADLDYLQQLYKVDQQNLEDLGQSVSKMKLLPPRLSYVSMPSSENFHTDGANQTFSFKSDNTHLRQWEGCNCVRIKVPSSSSLSLPRDRCILRQASFCQTHLQFHQKKQFLPNTRQKFMRHSFSGADKCCRLVVGGCSHHHKNNERTDNNGDLLRMETELKAIKERVEKLTGETCKTMDNKDKADYQLNPSEWSIISASEEDKSQKKEENVVCKNDICKIADKCICSYLKTLKNEKKSKCIIT